MKDLSDQIFERLLPYRDAFLEADGRARFPEADRLAVGSVEGKFSFVVTADADGHIAAGISMKIFRPERPERRRFWEIIGLPEPRDAEVITGGRGLMWLIRQGRPS